MCAEAQKLMLCLIGVEMFKKQLSEGQAGDNVGLLVRGLKRDEVQRGQVACKPGSIKPAVKFEGELYALTKEEGGRHTPFFSNYKPQFFFRTADITGTEPSDLSATVGYALSSVTTALHFPGTVTLPDGIEMVMPGDNVSAQFELITPVALEPSLRFAVREGGRTVGAGVVSKLL